MIELPDFEKSFEYENSFYLSCKASRMAKWITHFTLFMRSWSVFGDIVECGVFKGVSLVRFAMFRSLFGTPAAKRIVGIDVFGEFPETAFEEDRAPRRRFISEAGSTSISVDQLKTVLENKGCHENVELVAGDVCQTVPEYVKQRPSLKICLLHLDVDIYEPSVTVLEHLYPRLMPGGILILDDYGRFPGETKAVDEYFKDRKVEIQTFPFCSTPCFIVKD